MIVSNSDEFSNVKNDDGLDEHGVRHMYRDATWLQNSSEY
jgi:hypothetical protein